MWRLNSILITIIESDRRIAIADSVVVILIQRNTIVSKTLYEDTPIESKEPMIIYGRLVDIITGHDEEQ